MDTTPKQMDAAPRPTQARRLLASPATVISIIAVCAALTSTAVAANTVFSEDIVDGEVKTQDIRDDTASGALKSVDFANGSLGGTDINGITGGEIADASITGADVTDNSIGSADVAGLTGADVDEASLTGVGSVNDAHQLDDIDSSQLVIARSSGGDSGQCSSSLPTDAYETCADVTVPWTHSGRALVIAQGAWHPTFDGANSLADCRIAGPGVVESPAIDVGERDAFMHDETHELPFLVQEVTNALAAPASQEHEFRLECIAFGSGSDVDAARISVVVVGSASVGSG